METSDFGRSNLRSSERGISKRGSVDSLLDIPCFQCLARDRLKRGSHRCTPETCLQLEEWVLQEAQEFVWLRLEDVKIRIPKRMLQGISE